MSAPSLGMTIWSFRVRWWQRRSAPHAGFSAWDSPLDVMEHCAVLGCPSLQIGVDDWPLALAQQARARCEALGIELEAQIELPGDLERFERDLVAGKEAGASIFRCYCLLQRRYEHFTSRSDWERWHQDAVATLQRVEPILAKHRVKLAVENHKDWCAAEQADVFRHLASEWLGITLDFGNNLALLEDPLEVARTLAPWILSTHVKDMDWRDSEDGFLLSEVALGTGVLDLPALVATCRQANPKVRFLLEMIARDPLPVPCRSASYAATFRQPPNPRHLSLARPSSEEALRSRAELPRESHLDDAGALALEDRLIRESLCWWNQHFCSTTPDS